MVLYTYFSYIIGTCNMGQSFLLRERELIGYSMLQVRHFRCTIHSRDRDYQSVYYAMHNSQKETHTCSVIKTWYAYTCVQYRKKKLITSGVEDPNGAIAKHIKLSFDPPDEIHGFLYWPC